MKKRIYKSNGIKCSRPADLLETETIKAIENYLYAHSIRDWCCFCFANNTGLRASDLLSLTTDDLFENGKVKDNLVLYETKTNKLREITLNSKAKKVIIEYYQIKYKEIQKKGGKYLFPSRTAKIDAQGNKYYTGINVSSYDKVLRKAKIELNIPNYKVVSSHCSRKALGAALYMRGTPIELIQNMFMHDSPKTTMKYIGVYKKKAQSLYTEIEI